ncbi:MAG: hypothetical protein LBH93_06815 [Chitinispirillales bacterium]|jgi:hypothetical protein|nr:hypothetical protein [Chitinispirillales bacterium]
MASMRQLEDIMAQTWASIKELSESHKETERVLKENAAEAKLRSIEADKRSAEADKRIAKLERTVDGLTRKMGGLNNSIGEIVEMIIIPGVKENMNALGHNFNIASPRKEFSGADGASLTEVDLLLENCEAVMAVEVKTRFAVKWVERHLKRLELLRKNERITGMRGKTMYAAVAGIHIDTDARELAVENGMYIIEIEEDSERVSVVTPDNPRTW